jgi:hypothetical protein
MTDLPRPPIDRTFIIDELTAALAKLRAMELALTGLKKAQALSDGDREAIEFILSSIHCDIGELYLAMKKEEEGGTNG